MDDIQLETLKTEVLVNRMAIRAALSVLAKLANPADPREFISNVEEALFAQLDGDEPLFPGGDPSMRQVARTGVRDITGRLDWGSD